MRNLIYILIALTIGHTVYAQNSYPAEYSSVFTDRSFFISGEEIQFSGLIYMDSSKEILSKVIYVELIDPLGNKINQLKLYLNNNYFQARLLIPETTLSGYYFLRVYSKWMRNSMTVSFSKVMLKIVNPFLIDVQQLPDSLYIKANNEYSSILKNNSPDMEHFQSGEQIKLNLSDIDIPEFDILCVSVIPKATKIYFPIFNGDMPNDFSTIRFYPESRGLSLSGRLLNNQIPLPYHMVYLNIIGEKDFKSAFTDSLGKFQIPLPRNYYMQELILGVDYKDDANIQLKIYNDFELESELLKVPKFRLNAEEEKLSIQLAKQYQINKWYSDSVEAKPLDIEQMPFYGRADRIIDFSFYIPLDSLSLYFTDLPSNVYIKKRKGKRYLQVIGQETGLSIYHPLLLVDWIPVNDAELVLAMSPHNIKKIEVLNRLYYHGNRIYAGIIHVQTMEGNMADLKLPNTNIYLNYQFPQPETDEPKLQFPGTSFWKVLSDHELLDISFKAPKLSGDYLIQIQGIDKEGALINKNITFKVLAD